MSIKLCPFLKEEELSAFYHLNGSKSTSIVPKQKKYFNEYLPRFITQTIEQTYLLRFPVEISKIITSYSSEKGPFRNMVLTYYKDQMLDACFGKHSKCAQISRLHSLNFNLFFLIAPWIIGFRYLNSYSPFIIQSLHLKKHAIKFIPQTIQNIFAKVK